MTRTDLEQGSMSPNLIREIIQTVSRFISGILYYLNYLKNVFILNKCILNIKIILYFYIIFYFILLY